MAIYSHIIVYRTQRAGADTTLKVAIISSSSAITTLQQGENCFKLFLVLIGIMLTWLLIYCWMALSKARMTTPLCLQLYINTLLRLNVNYCRQHKRLFVVLHVWHFHKSSLTCVNVEHEEQHEASCVDYDHKAVNHKQFVKLL